MSMSMKTIDTQWSQAFAWSPQPGAEALIHGWVQAFVEALPPAQALARRMAGETGTRFLDWVDTIVLAGGDTGAGAGAGAAALAAAGFVVDADDARPRVWRHPGGLFPRVVEQADADAPMQVWIRCDAVDDFRAAHSLAGHAEGLPWASLRRVLYAREAGAALWAVERHGYAGVAPDASGVGVARAAEAVAWLERFRDRARDTDEDGFARAHALVDEAIARVGVDVACDLFFEAERALWAQRCQAARAQKARQDRLGLGWGNHDHHTYRSSRRYFGRLIGVLEKLGFVLRERFYAGREAGWGAQVLEQPQAGIAVFADVDLSPDEVLGDFAHEPLAERDTLGTVGLWCALHGDSFLQAGMHHLACRADFDALRGQLRAEAGIASMKPFTDLPHLEQCFTEGERWPVATARIDALARAGRIDDVAAERFRREGAIGSHLEIVERNAGFKGFNQTGISEIIAATDPRRHGTR